MNSDNNSTQLNKEDKYPLLKFGIMLDVPILLEGPPSPYKRRGSRSVVPQNGWSGREGLENRAGRNMRIIQEN